MRCGLNIEQLLYRVPGGVGRYTERLWNGLPALYPEDEVVGFVARHKEGDVLQAARQDGAAPVRLPLPRPVLYDAWHTVGWPSVGRLDRRLAALDVMHAPSLAVPPKGDARLIVTVHDLAHEIVPETFTRRGRWFHRRGLAAAVARADALICPSQATATELLERTGTHPDRVHVVPLGVDHVEVTVEDVRRARATHGLGDHPFVLFVGTLEPRKNLGTLVEAFARVVRAHDLPHILVVVGPEGWGDNEVVASQAALLGDRIRFLGEVPDAELFALYRGAALFAMPSLYEGFGLPLLEAMSQGAPVLAADTSSLRDLGSGVARLVPPTDVEAWQASLLDLLEDHGNDGMVAAGRERAAAFTWEACVRRTHDVYERTLARQG